MKRATWMIALLLIGCSRPADGPNDVVAEDEPSAPAAATEAEGQEPEPEPANARTEAEAINGSVSACLVQDGERIPENALRAIGTEPFWGADVKGRCVTYSTPENQAGTRVWTKFLGTARNGSWTGALDGQPFVMTTRPEPGCSDGMSDNRYPIAVKLTVRGERRTGCAEPR